MADIESNINLNINGAEALATIKALQREISQFHTEMARMGSAEAARSAQMQQQLVSGINAAGKFSAQMKTIQTTTESFTTSLEKNKFSMGEYFRYAMASTKSFGGAFQNELRTIDTVARERVKDLQTQYIQMGRDANGAMRSIAIRPLALDLNDFGTQTAMAAQKHQIFNRLIEQGSTNLLNWGKNTQWAGRQLMVGFSVPLGIFAMSAGQAFMQLEEAAVKFKRVYGDAMTPAGEGEAMVKQVKDLAGTFTQYGVSVTNTMEMAGSAAAMGATGEKLLSQVAQTNKLAVLGGIEQQQSLETITSLTNTFGIATKDLAGNIDFLNAVENQTVLSIEDMSTAIPIAAPVVQQLGGNVKDLSVMLVAMKEGGINASEGANALKSGLASLINPTETATTALGEMGVDLNAILNENRGNAMGMLKMLATQLDQLDPTTRAQAIEQLFGKFQFARMSTLLENINKQGTQAAKALELTTASASELAAISSKELNAIAESPAYKFKKSIEDFKAALAPVGETFVKIATPIIEIGTNILNWFNGLGEQAKAFAVTLVVGLGVVAPTLLMIFGLVANGVANLTKFVSWIGKAFSGSRQSAQMLGETTNYLTRAQLEADAVAASLDQAHNKLIQRFTSEQDAIDGLTAAYERMIAAQLGSRGAVTPRASAKPSGTPSLEDEALQRSHLTGHVTQGTKAWQGAVAGSRFAGLPPELQQYLRVTTNLVAELPASLNQALRSKEGGVGIDQFMSQWGSRSGKLNLSAQLGGADLSNPKIAAQVQKLENEIGKRAAELARGTKNQLVNDDILTKATKEIVNEYRKAGGAMGQAASSLYAASRQVGDIRLGIPAEVRKRLLESGQMTEQPGQSGRYQVNGINVARQGSSGAWREADRDMPKGSFARARSWLSTAIGGKQEEIQAVETQAIKESAAARKAQTRALTLSAEELAAYNTLDKAEKAAVTRARKKQIAAIEANAEAEVKLTAAEQAAMAKLQAGGPTGGPGKGGRLGRFLGGIGPGKVAGAAGALTGISMVGSMMPGPIGEMFGSSTGLFGAVTAASTAMMMIPGPIGIALGAIAALSVGIISFNEAMDSARQKGIELADSMSMTKEKMQSLESLTGNTAISTSAASARSADLSTIRQNMTKEQTDALNQFKQQIADSGVGKQFLDDIKKQVESGSTMSDIANNMSTQLSTAVAEGVMTKDQADTIAQYLGESLKDRKFTVDIQAQLSEILGPNGQNLINDPGAVINLITQRNNAQAVKAGQLATDRQVNPITESKTALGTGNALGVATAGAGLAAAGIAGFAGATATLGTALAWNPVGWAALAVAGVAAVTAGVVGMVNAQEENTKYAAMATEMYSNAYTQNLKLSDTIKGQYDNLINSKKAQLDAATTDQERLKLNEEIARLQKSQADALDRQRTANQGLIQDAVTKKDKIGDTTWDAANKKQIEKTYKDDAVMQELAKKQYDIASNDQNISNRQTQATLEIQISSGALDPATAENLLTAMKEHPDVQQDYNVMIKQVGDQAAIDLVSSLTAAGANDQTLKKQLDIIANVEDPQKAKDLTDQITKASELAAQLSAQGISININDDGALEKLQKANDGMAQISDLFATKSPVTADIVMNTVGFQMTQEAQDYYNGLPPSQQKDYITAYWTIYETATDAQVSSLYAKTHTLKQTESTSIAEQRQWYSDQKGRDAVAANLSTPAPTTTPYRGGGGSGGSAAKETTTTTTKEPTSWIDDVVKKVRDVAAAGRAMTDTFTDSWAAINGMFGNGSSPMFNGIEQQMRRLGAGQDVISRITGMSKEDWEKYKDQLFNFDSAGNITSFKSMLSTIATAIRATQLADFQNKQQQALTQTNDQVVAIRKLVAAGLSYSEAANAVSDAATASAVANETNAASINAVAAASRAAAQAARGLADAQALASSTETFEKQKKIYDFLKANSANFTDAETKAILGSQDLQNSIIDMMTGNTSFDKEQLKKALQTAVSQTQLDLNISKLTIEGMSKVFSDGLSKATEEFDAQKNKIDIQLKIDGSEWQKIVDENQQRIQDLQNGPNGLNSLQGELDRIADKEIDINKKYEDRNKALDRIQAANQAIAAQQRSQLSIADALSNGDIAAAARAAQEQRATAADQAMTDTRNLLNAQQQTELANLTGANGMTRSQIEEQIRKIKMQVLEIEQQSINPAQYQLDLLQRRADLEKANLSVVIDGKRYTEDAFAALQNRIDLAKTASQDYADAIRESVTLVNELENAWYSAGLEASKAGTTIDTETALHTTTTTTTTPAPTAAPTAAPAPAGLSDAEIQDYARRVIRGEFGNGQARRNALGSNYQVIQDRVNRILYQGYANGGLVNYLANGGFPGIPKIGTDTVPAMLTPGEFVVKKFAVDQFGANNLHAINSGTYDGGSVYNSYEVNVNVKSDANPDQIARAVTEQIRSIDAQRIRGNRL